MFFQLFKSLYNNPKQLENGEIPVYGQPRLARSGHEKSKPRFVFGLGKRAGGWDEEEDNTNAEETFKDLGEFVDELEERMMQEQMRNEVETNL